MEGRGGRTGGNGKEGRGLEGRGNKGVEGKRTYERSPSFKFPLHH